MLITAVMHPKMGKDIKATFAGTLFIFVIYYLAILMGEMISPHDSDALLGLFLLVIAPTCLSIGGFITGYISGRNTQEKIKFKKILIISPGIYIAIIGFAVNLVIDKRLSPDSIVPLLTVGVVVTLITSFFTYKGYNYLKLNNKNA